MQGIQIMATLYFIDPALGTFLTYLAKDLYIFHLGDFHSNYLVQQ